MGRKTRDRPTAEEQNRPGLVDRLDFTDLPSLVKGLPGALMHHGVEPQLGGYFELLLE